jgi:hypothetical protein
MVAVGDYNCTLVNSTKLGIPGGRATPAAPTAGSPANTTGLGTDNNAFGESPTSRNNTSNNNSRISPQIPSRAARLLLASKQAAHATGREPPALEQHESYKQDQEQQHFQHFDLLGPALGGNSAAKQLSGSGPTSADVSLLGATARAQYVCSKLGAGQNYRWEWDAAVPQGHTACSADVWSMFVTEPWMCS